MATLTSKLVPYKNAGPPVLKGGEQLYVPHEFGKVAQAIQSIEQILVKLETSPVMATTAGVPTTADVATGTWKVIWDTAHSTVGLYANMGGVLKSVLLT